MQFVEITQVSLRQVHYVNAIIDVVSVMLTMMILALYCGPCLTSSCLAGGCIHKHVPIFHKPNSMQTGHAVWNVTQPFSLCDVLLC